MNIIGSSIDDVRDFWNKNPCGNKTYSDEDRLAYFLGIEKYRYSTIPYIPKIANFNHFDGKNVLEIGCGMGTDGTQFAKAGAQYYGIDLTEAAIRLAQENFYLRGLSGAFRQMNAEQLIFPDAMFDHVYSMGVIHHTVNPSAIVDEIFRVLKPGGTLTIMLYNRTSINYYFEIMFLRKIGRALLKPSWAPEFFSSVFGLPLEKLKRHREVLFKNPHPSHGEWISMNTDGPDNPLSRVYSAKEAAALFVKFTDVVTEPYFFDRSHWPFIECVVSDNLAEKIGRRWGWNRIIYAKKPDN
jgi:ubiquinone/menaquinone biosynthesis C-methylase UbiE